MKVAVHAVGEIGRRVIRVLQAEPAVTSVAVWGVESPGPRVPVIERLDDVEVVVTDRTEAESLAEACVAGSASLVTADNWATELAGDLASVGRTLVMGANLETGLATTLALQEAALMDEPLEVRIAWTTPGRPLRRGEAIPFPDPVGSHWAREVDLMGWTGLSVPAAAFEARVDGQWAGAMAQVSGALDGGVQRTIVGTADHAAFLSAIALAAPVVPVGQSLYPPGFQWPSAAPSAYLDRALAAGLDVASFHETTPA